MKDIYRHIIAILLLVIILLYPIVCYCAIHHAGLSYIITSIVFMLPVLALTMLLPRKWLYCVIVVLLAIGTLIELTMVDLYQDYLQSGAIISTLWTNPQEASEFYHTNLFEILHWIPIIILAGLSCWAFRPLKSIRVCGGALLVSCIMPIGFIAYKLNVFYHDNPITLRYYMNNRVWNRPPYNVLYASFQAHDRLQKRKMIELAQSIDMGAHRDVIPSQKEIYVLAIGESLRYSNVSLNGRYSRSTTPHLETMENIVSFDDYYSQACLTMYSVPMLITRATPQNYDLNYAEPSLIAPFRECGFKTFVVVNTNLLSYEKYLSNGSDSLIIVPNVVENGEILSGDKTIVHIIDSLASQHDKLFIICQLLGNHSFYTNYEKECDIYHPNSNDPGVGYSYESLINAYDNSILYTDYILSSIIDAIDRSNAISAMMFISDHGENISETGGGHGGNCAPSLEEYHVPYIYWWSSDYAAQYPDKVQHARAHKEAKINGDNVFYSVCGMAGITLDSAYNENTWDVLSPEFKEHERLILVPDGVTTIGPDKE